tara:strand:+ start:919 stop:1218 length:300 start_codon:yes stop_codon:yes gene_type:complete
MRKSMAIIIIIILIFFTSFIKNSTKEIDEEIYITQERIGKLQSEYENLKLEYNYLSSPQKLLEYQNLYFDDELIPIDINSLNRITIEKDKINFNKFLNE